MCSFKCNSAQHFVCDCTGLWNNINTVVESDQIHFTLFNVSSHYQNVMNDSNIKMSMLLREKLAMMLLDSASSWTVVGKLGFDIFFDMLKDKHLVKTAKSYRTLCFGDGVEVKAIKWLQFPVTIEGVKGIRM